MKSKAIFFVLGVVVAAAVYEVTDLRLRGDRIGHQAPSAAPSIAAPDGPSRAPAKLAATPPPALPERSVPSTDLQAELDAAKSRAVFAERQLEAIEGQPVPWPNDVAPAFKKESVERQLKEYIVDKGLGKLKSLDCSEYPCVEVLQLNDPSPEGTKALHAAINDLVKQHYKGNVMVGIQVTRVGRGADVTSYAGVGIAPNETDVRSRARYRAKLELEEYSQ